MNEQVRLNIFGAVLRGVAYGEVFNRGHALRFAYCLAWPTTSTRINFCSSETTYIQSLQKMFRRTGL